MKGGECMGTPFAILLSLFLSVFHNGHIINTNTDIQADVTVTPSVTPDVTITPTETPTLTPTITEEPTITATPTPTVSVTPSVVPEQDKDNDNDEDHGLHIGKGHFLKGLFNAIWHHQRNEERFEKKHGLTPTITPEPTL